jgi:hypothetical protein
MNRDDKERRNSKIVIGVFVGTVLVCTLSVAVYMYYILY